MDNLRGFEEDRGGGPDDGRGVGGYGDGDDAVGSVSEARAIVGGDERRMHVRAYNHWVSLLAGRPYPSIADLDPAGIADFGPHSVLLDFTGGSEDPGIAFLGRALREECGLGAHVARIAEVPGRSLLSRLTDHYLQIIANRAPVGFEAEFVGTRGHTTMYRGILLPFSSDGAGIDYIYGVINWKELADAGLQAGLARELDAALAAAPPAAPAAPVWADGPGAVDDPVAAPSAMSLETEAPNLADRLALARDAAAAFAEADARSHAALYAALGHAHDFALASADDPAGYAELLADCGIAAQARAPMTAIARLVFTAADKARLTEYAAVLAHAARTAVPAGALSGYLAAADGGMKAIVAIERAARRADRPARPARRDPAAAIAARPALATVRLPVDAGAGYVLLLGRVAGDAVEIVADVTEEAPLARALRRAA